MCLGIFTLIWKRLPYTFPLYWW